MRTPTEMFQWWQDTSKGVGSTHGPGRYGENAVKSELLLALSIPAAESRMEHLNWGYIQLALVALAFGGLQVWWISSVFWKRDLARPQSGEEFRKTLERIWKKEQR